MATLRALECLVAVMETESVTAAAARLHLSQPALSHQLAGLEREVGTSLLERLPRGVRPTAAGRAAAADARLAIDAARRSVDAAQAVAAGSSGHIRVGTAESLTVPLLAPALRAWRQRHPSVRISLDEMSSANQLNAALSDGHLDLVLSPRPDGPSGPLTVVGDEEVVAALPPDHPLATRRQAPTLGELASEPLVHYRPANGLRSWLDRQAARRQVILTPSVETRHATAAAMLAASGLGVALVPTSALNAPFPGRLRHLRPRLTRQIVIITTGNDPLSASLSKELLRRGVPPPTEIAHNLGPRARE